MERTLAFMDCRGYLSGAIDMAIAIEQTADSVNMFCQPRNGMSMDAWYEVMLRFAEKRPDLVETSARQFILFAMLDQMGC